MKKILEVIVGSTVHGTAVQDGLEDLDLMAIMLEDMPTFVGFNPTDTWTERTKPVGVRSEAGDTDWVGYGLRKYLSLALKGNPTVLLALFVPESHTKHITPQGFQLQCLASHIVSKAAYMPFRGYMIQQYERLIGVRGQGNITRPELIEAYGYDTKYAGHVVRLGLQGEELLTTGRISLPMREADRALCIKIRTGGFAFEELTGANGLIAAVERRLEEAFLKSELPEKPNTQYVETWMLNTYLAHWNAPT
jgi:uncharacterized protein